jgi:hypothetical protein
LISRLPVTKKMWKSRWALEIAVPLPRHFIKLCTLGGWHRVRRIACRGTLMRCLDTSSLDVTIRARAAAEENIRSAAYRRSAAAIVRVNLNCRRAGAYPAHRVQKDNRSGCRVSELTTDGELARDIEIRLLATGDYRVLNWKDQRRWRVRIQGSGQRLSHRRDGRQSSRHQHGECGHLVGCR